MYVYSCFGEGCREKKHKSTNKNPERHWGQFLGHSCLSSGFQEISDNVTVRTRLAGLTSLIIYFSYSNSLNTRYPDNLFEIVACTSVFFFFFRQPLSKQLYVYKYLAEALGSFLSFLHIIQLTLTKTNKKPFLQPHDTSC